MSLAKYQKGVDDWVRQYKIGYFKPLEMLACLTEETGEVAREINHLFGPKPKKSSEETKELADELGDIIFDVVCIANSLNLDLDKAFKNKMNKCYGRDNDRWEKK